MSAEDFKDDFQTPIEVADYMAHLLAPHVKSIRIGDQRVLEPTPGKGNLVRAAINHGMRVVHHQNYFNLHYGFSEHRFGGVIMNPPFSERSMLQMPVGWIGKGMRVGYQILKECMGWSDNIVALMPAFTLSDSDVRAREIKRFGLVSVTQLPRKTFAYARIQTVVLHLKKGYTGPTEYKLFDLLNKDTYQEEL